jgi:hypothetical protein
MTPELQVLAYAGLLQGVQYVLMSVSANLDLGPGKTMSARDVHRLGRPLAEMLGVRAGRLYRAFTNHLEGLILFTLAVVVVTLADRARLFRRLRLDLSRRAHPLCPGLFLRPRPVALDHLVRRFPGDDGDARLGPCLLISLERTAPHAQL